jgi:hypothetical protein
LVHLPNSFSLHVPCFNGCGNLVGTIAFGRHFEERQIGHTVKDKRKTFGY